MPRILRRFIDDLRWIRRWSLFSGERGGAVQNLGRRVLREVHLVQRLKCQPATEPTVEERPRWEDSPQLLEQLVCSEIEHHSSSDRGGGHSSIRRLQVSQVALHKIDVQFSSNETWVR